jgi:hypothetical protein
MDDDALYPDVFSESASLPVSVRNGPVKNQKSRSGVSVSLMEKPDPFLSNYKKQRFYYHK